MSIELAYYRGEKIFKIEDEFLDFLGDEFVRAKEHERGKTYPETFEGWLCSLVQNGTWINWFNLLKRRI